MDDTFRSLREQIDAIPVIDAHEHSCGHDACQPVDGVTGFVLSHYVGSILAHISPEHLDVSLADVYRMCSRRCSSALA